MYIVFSKNFDLLYWNMQTAIALISPTWARKNWIQLCARHLRCVKILTSQIQTCWRQLGIIQPPEAEIRRVHKKFYFVDSNMLTDITLISASSAQKHFDSNLQDVMYVTFMKNFWLHRLEQVDGQYAHFSLLSLKTLDSNFLDIWTSCSAKIFISWIETWWSYFDFAVWNKLTAVILISPSWVQLPENHVRRVHENGSSRRFKHILSHKTIWFKLSRHHERRIQEKFLSRRLEHIWRQLGSSRPCEPKKTWL